LIGRLGGPGIWGLEKNTAKGGGNLLGPGIINGRGRKLKELKGKAHPYMVGKRVADRGKSYRGKKVTKRVSLIRFKRGTKRRQNFVLESKGIVSFK